MTRRTDTSPKPGKELAAWTERDLTRAARDGELPRAHGRDALLERIQQILATSRSAVLAGEPGVGKSALVYELVHRWSTGDGPESLCRRRVLQISLRRRASALEKPHELGSRLAALVEELHGRTDDILLFVRDFHHLWTFDLEPQFESLLYRLDGPLICEGERGLVGSIFDHYPELERHYVVLPVDEPSLGETREILGRWAEEETAHGDPASGEEEEGRTENDEARTGARFDPGALDMALQLSHRFLARGRLPRKALEPLKQLTALRPPGERIRSSHVIERFCDSYALPRFLVDSELPLEPDELERELSSRLLGQPEAVSAVIDLIFLIKAGLSDPRRPFGVFLFVGPTGVGKTLLAQLLAERLFGARGGREAGRLTARGGGAASAGDPARGHLRAFALAERRGDPTRGGGGASGRGGAPGGAACPAGQVPGPARTHQLRGLLGRLGGEPVEAQPLARVYNEGGTGARDPRTGALLPRLKDALRGRLDPLLEAWRRSHPDLRQEPRSRTRV